MAKQLTIPPPRALISDAEHRALYAVWIDFHLGMRHCDRAECDKFLPALNALRKALPQAVLDDLRTRVTAENPSVPSLRFIAKVAAFVADDFGWQWRFEWFDINAIMYAMWDANYDANYRA